MLHKRVIYISGPIDGVPEYFKAFEEAEEKIEGYGYIALTPSRLPLGMTEAQYMRINFALIDSADEVLFLEGWERSAGSRLERSYCEYTGKSIVSLNALQMRKEMSDVIRAKLKEVL